MKTTFRCSLLVLGVALCLAAAATESHLQGQHIRLRHHGALLIGDVASLDWIPSQDRLLVATEESLVLVGPRQSSILQQYPVPEGDVRSALYLAGTNSIVILQDDKTLTLLDLTLGQFGKSVDTDEEVRHISSDPKGERILVVGHDGLVVEYSGQLQPIRRYESDNLYGKDLVFGSYAQRGREIFVLSDDNRSASWSVGQLHPYRSSSPSRQELYSAATDFEGELVAIAVEKLSLVRSVRGLNAEAEHMIELRDLNRGRVVREITDVGDLGPLDWNTDRRIIFMVQDGNRITAFDIDSGDAVDAIDTRGSISLLTVHPRGDLLATAAEGGGVELFAIERPIAAMDVIDSESTLLPQQKYQFTTSSEPVLKVGAPVTLAILEIAAREVADGVAAAFRDLLSSQLANSRHARLIEREAVDRVLEEIRFENSGLTSADAAAEIGRLVNAAVVLVGGVSKLGEATVLSARLVETETGEVLGAREIVCNACGLEDIPLAAARIVRALVPTN